MKKLIVVMPIIFLVACSGVKPSEPVYKLSGFSGAVAMDSNEVLQNSKRCILSKMKPNVQYLSVPTEHGKMLVPVNVFCEPY